MQKALVVVGDPVIKTLATKQRNHNVLVFLFVRSEGVR